MGFFFTVLIEVFYTLYRILSTIRIKIEETKSLLGVKKVLSRFKLFSITKIRKYFFLGLLAPIGPLMVRKFFGRGKNYIIIIIIRLHLLTTFIEIHKFFFAKFL